MASKKPKKPKKTFPEPAGQDISDADLILVDAKNALWRGIHAQTGSLGVALTPESFKRTGAVYGFLTAVLAVCRKAPDADVYVCWEGSKANRRAIVEEYKSHRETPPHMAELFKIVASQKALLVDILTSTTWVQANSKNWEADDVMATLAATGKRAGMNVLIYSTDADMYQCLFEDNHDDPDKSEQWVRQYAAKKSDKNAVWTASRLFTEIGIHPWQVPHMKALAGDSSDGYKGVNGVGAKTAAAWLAGDKSWPDVVDDCKAGTITGKRAEAVLESIDYIERCHKIAIARDDVRVRLVQPNTDRARLQRVLHGLKMHSLANTMTLNFLTRT